MAWKKGPLPAGTYNWGGVVPVGQEGGYGFYFADFCGDHVKALEAGEHGESRVLKPEEVAYYDNSLEPSPGPNGPRGRA